MFSASATRWMPALLTSTSIRPASRSTAREGGGDAVGVRDVGRQVGDAGVARLGLAEVEGKDRRALVEEAERRSRRRCRAPAPVTTATLPSNAIRGHGVTPSSYQYISQPPLTLIVAPVM